MTVAEIKEFVKSEKTRLYNQVEDSTDLMDDLDDYDELLKDILSMLDELEPNIAKWRNIGSGLECTQCKNIIQEWGEVIPEYCDCCGARMEVEDDTTPTNV